MESILYVNMTYDQVQELARMEDENSVFKFLKARYEITETIASLKIDNTKLILKLKHNEKD